MLSTFCFLPSQDYQYFGTELDKWDKLNLITGAKVPHLTQVAAQFAGHIALRLVHDHLLRMDLAKYDKFIRAKVVQINVKVKNVQRVSVETKVIFTFIYLKTCF